MARRRGDSPPDPRAVAPAGPPPRPDPLRGGRRTTPRRQGSAPGRAPPPSLRASSSPPGAVSPVRAARSPLRKAGERDDGRGPGCEPRHRRHAGM